MSALFIDPNPIAFIIPFFNIAIAWYGILFAIGAIGAHFFGHQVIKIRVLLKNPSSYTGDTEEQFIEKASRTDRFFIQLLPRDLQKQAKASYLDKWEEKKAASKAFVERAFLWGVIGGIIGARLGHVFFYEWSYYSDHLLEIFNTRAGGLASHGGVIGLCISWALLGLKTKKEKWANYSFLDILDLAAITTPFLGFCIRIGNFVNQEILGTASSLPWAVSFGHPVDGLSGVGRHPVQLYESSFFLLLFFIFLRLFFIQPLRKKGVVTGLFFLSVFSFRFFIEFFKEKQSLITTSLNMGAWLSIPLIILGLWLVLRTPARSVSVDSSV